MITAISRESASGGPDRAMNRPGLLSAARRAAKASAALVRRDRPKGASPSAAKRPAADTGDRRLLDAILQLNSARGEAETVRALAAAIVTATRYDAAAVVQAHHAENARTVVAAHLSGEDGGHSALIGLSGDSPAMTRAIEHGAAVVISGDSALAAPANALPSWAVKRGYTSGIAAPVTRGPETLAAVYVLRRQPLPVPIEDIQRVEVLLNLASRHFPAVASAPGARPVDPGTSPYPPLADISETAAPRDNALSTPHPVPVGGVVLSLRRPERIEGSKGPGAALVRSPELAPVPNYPPSPAPRLPLTTSGLTLDPARERVEVGGIRLALSSTEFALLYAIAAASGPLSCGDLASHAWTEGEAPSVNAVEVALCRLRKRLSRVPGGAGVIETVRGRGYRFCAPRPDAPEGLSLTRTGQDA